MPQDELEEDEEEVTGGTMSAIERSRTHEESPVDGPKRKGFRTRAKSLTHTVTDLFGVSRKNNNRTDGADDGADRSAASRPAIQSTETL